MRLSQPSTVLSTLLTTKLAIPPLRAQAVLRPRLTQQIQAVLTRPLTLIAAPAGFGKTTLVCEWIAQTTHAVAWLSLDEDDNDLTRFLSYLIAALRTGHSTLGERALELLSAPQPPPAKAILTLLINELQTVTEPLILVLDDYHLLTTAAIHEAVTFLLDHMPPTLHLVITTRADPPLPLARWRARNQLNEVRMDDLRFRTEEAATFLNEVMGLSLTPTEINALARRTEGWISGLQLAALSLQGRADPAGFVKAFTGSHRFILNYLTEEVLQRQPAPLQTFLLETSILDQLTGDLCDAVTGRTDSHILLEQCEQANLFISALDHEGLWYRYHALFADLLRHRLQRQAADQLPILHRRAALWYAQHNQMNEAIKHALAMADFEQAAVWVEQIATDLWTRGEMGVLLGWIKSLPVSIVHARPRLALAYGWILIYTGPLDAVEVNLQAVEDRLSEGTETTLRGEIAVIRASVASLQGNITRTITFCQQALQWIAAENSYLRAMTMQALGFAYRVNGESNKAAEVLTEALALARIHNNFFWLLDALCNLGLVQIMQGQLCAARHTLQGALDLVDEQGGEVLPIAGEVYSTWALLLYEWYELENAEAQLQKSLRLGERGENQDILISSYFTLAMVKQTTGQQTQALTVLKQAQQLAQQYQATRVIRRLNALQAQLWVAAGKLDAAERWAERVRLSQEAPSRYLHAVEQLTLARLRFAQGQPTVALTLLDSLSQTAQAEGRIGNLIQYVAVRSLIQRSQGAREEAVATLLQALQLAQPEGYVTTFIDEGEAMQALLLEAKRVLASQRERPNLDGLLLYVDQLLTVFSKGEEQSTINSQQSALLRVNEPQPTIPALIEPLSDRELEVLALIAAGLSNREIGDKLVIEVGTVKRHLTNLFGKLGVTSRTQAIAYARQLGLL